MKIKLVICLLLTGLLLGRCNPIHYVGILPAYDTSRLQTVGSEDWQWNRVTKIQREKGDASTIYLDFAPSLHTELWSEVDGVWQFQVRFWDGTRWRSAPPLAADPGQAFPFAYEFITDERRPFQGRLVWTEQAHSLAARLRYAGFDGQAWSQPETVMDINAIQLLVKRVWIEAFQVYLDPQGQETAIVTVGSPAIYYEYSSDYTYFISKRTAAGWSAPARLLPDQAGTEAAGRWEFQPDLQGGLNAYTAFPEAGELQRAHFGAQGFTEPATIPGLSRALYNGLHLDGAGDLHLFGNDAYKTYAGWRRFFYEQCVDASGRVWAKQSPFEYETKNTWPLYAVDRYGDQTALAWTRQKNREVWLALFHGCTQTEVLQVPLPEGPRWGVEQVSFSQTRQEVCLLLEKRYWHGVYIVTCGGPMREPGTSR